MQPSTDFKGWSQRGGYRAGHRPDTCGNPATGNTAAPGLALMEHKDRRPCEVCFEASRPGRSLCNRHRLKGQHYGHPEASSQFNTKLIGRDVADALRLMEHIRRLPKDDQARLQLQNAELWVRCQLDDNRGYDLRGYRPGLPATLRQRRRWGNLANAGVAPERVLAMVAGMFTARDVFEPSFLSHAHWLFQLGRAVATLATLPKQTWSPPYKDEGVMPSVAVPIGERLVDKVGVFCGGLSLALQTGRTFGAVPALTAGLPPPSKAACQKAVARKQWQPKET